MIGPRIQPFSHPLTFNFPWSLGYIRKLAFGSPWGSYFTPGFVCSQHMAPRNINLHRHHLLRVPIHTLVEWSLGDSFLMPREIYCQCRFKPRTSQSAVESSTTGQMHLDYMVKLTNFVAGSTNFDAGSTSGQFNFGQGWPQVLDTISIYVKIVLYTVFLYYINIFFI